MPLPSTACSFVRPDAHYSREIYNVTRTAVHGQKCRNVRRPARFSPRYVSYLFRERCSRRMIASSSASWSRFSPPSNFFNAHVLQDFTKLMPNIHRHTRHDKTVLSVSCLVCRCELGDCSGRVRTSNFLSATVLSCRKSSSHHRRGRDTDKTVLSCLAWRCEFAFTHF